MEAGEAVNLGRPAFMPRDERRNGTSLQNGADVADAVGILRVGLQNVQEPGILKSIEHAVAVVVLQHVLVEEDVNLVHVCGALLLRHRHRPYSQLNCRVPEPEKWTPELKIQGPTKMSSKTENLEHQNGRNSLQKEKFRTPKRTPKRKSQALKRITTRRLQIPEWTGIEVSPQKENSLAHEHKRVE